MSETILNALVQLFALISDIHDETVITSREKDIVRTFLARQLNNELVVRYMKMFEEYLGFYNSENVARGSIKDRKHISLNAMRILAICEKINEELQQKQKIYVLIQLMDFISSGSEITENELDFLQTVANAFYIPETEYNNIKNFIINSGGDIREKNRMLIIDNKKDPGSRDIKHIFNENLKGNILFLHIASTNTYILRYSGHEDLYLNGQNIFSGQTYIFDHGSSIRGSGIKPVYYTEVFSLISEASYESKIFLVANDVEFKFKNSENGIQNLNMHEESGKLVGILGGSGVGKSTTLSILNGTLKPQSGEVLINGYNLYDNNEKDHLKGVIGFVPQDDLLIEDLTVYQNLYYNAKMCLNNLSENEIVEVVNKTLADFDLDDTRDLKVGNPLKKVISGGQRKRVNIALELLREPTILFVDEPTSGLSSIDSEMVMNLLKEQTYKGKLVIINIHQPSSEIYKMFDKIMIIDKGGYQIYYGNPSEAIVYFKKVSNHSNPDEDQCSKCGNINTDQILQIIESKVINERGKATRTRKITPRELAEKFRTSSAGLLKKGMPKKLKLPENNFSIPGLLKQSGIFFARDLLSKLANRQYILISLLGPPLLAFLLAYFTKYTDGDYKFSENENIPAYLFMCVITSLFFGLMISSEEIVKDRKILKRESFLNLSWFSYLNSKIMIMFILSAIQTISFVIIGNLILGIKGMMLSYWLVLFTTSCASNILGLNISSAFSSVITIYIIIPFIIIPQLLFSGVLVKFDKLHMCKYSSREFVPVIGDLMIARWSFEALAVYQFKNNGYEKHFFQNKLDESQNLYYSSFLINDRLNKDLWVCRNLMDSISFRDEVKESFNRLNYHINELVPLTGFKMGLWKDSLNTENYSQDVEKKTIEFLTSLKSYFIDLKKKAYLKVEAVSDSLTNTLGEKGRISLRDNYENKQLLTLVLNRDNTVIAFKTPGKYIQKLDPGYMKPTSTSGRAHFYAPVKKLGNMEIDTYWFNISVIWIVSIMFYLILCFNLPNKLISYFENLRLPKSEV